MDLSDSWPSFFHHLDSDPQRAQREFCEWAMRFFAACPPSVLSAIPKEQRESICFDIMGDCLMDDFRVLRKYRNRGKPFAAWFVFVTRHRIIDRIRSIKRTPDVGQYDANTGGGDRPEWEPVVVEHHTLKRILDVVEQCIGQMTEQCQLLLRLSADEAEIPEILEMRLVAADTNKKMSNAIRHCQKRLWECVKSKGVDISQIL